MPSEQTEVAPTSFIEFTKSLLKVSMGLISLLFDVALAQDMPSQAIVAATVYAP